MQETRGVVLKCKLSMAFKSSWIIKKQQHVYVPMHKHEQKHIHSVLLGCHALTLVARRTPRVRACKWRNRLHLYELDAGRGVVASSTQRKPARTAARAAAFSPMLRPQLRRKAPPAT